MYVFYVEMGKETEMHKEQKKCLNVRECSQRELAIA